MSPVRFSREIRIPASPAAVWSVLSTPSQQPVVWPGVRLVSEWGEPGTLGSGYELAMPGRPVTRARVVEVVPGERHVATIDWSGRTRGSQEALLQADGADCLLSYTMSLDAPWGLRSLQRVYGKKRLGHWLEAVARVSTAVDGRQH